MTQRVRRVVCYHLARRRTGVYRLRLDNCPSYSRGAKGTPVIVTPIEMEDYSALLRLFSHQGGMLQQAAAEFLTSLLPGG